MHRRDNVIERNGENCTKVYSVQKRLSERVYLCKRAKSL